MSHFAFVTGTRADWAKLRPLVQALVGDPMEASYGQEHTVSIIATGLHLSQSHGYTVKELWDTGLPVYCVPNGESDALANVLGMTALGLQTRFAELQPTHVVVHGDRTEALAGAFAARCHGATVIHVEGGERSGSIDDRIRPCVTEMADHHLVANYRAAELLEMRGCRSIHVIGDPGVDVLLGERPSMDVVRERYDLPPKPYLLVIVHGCVGEDGAEVGRHIGAALQDCPVAIVQIASNADPGSRDVSTRVVDYSDRDIRCIPSMRPEHFATLLKHAWCLVGNSSVGQHQAPYYGTPVVEVGARQEGRRENPDAVRVPPVALEIADAIEAIGGKMRPIRRGRGEYGVGKRFRALVDKGVFG